MVIYVFVQFMQTNAYLILVIFRRIDISYHLPATAIAFAEQGCNLILADTDSQQTKLEEVVSACYDAATAAGTNSNINDNNISIFPHVCNVTNRIHAQRTICAADEVARTATKFSNSVASILVNCAGITRDGRLANLSNNDWDEVLDVNLKGTFLMCQEFCEPTRLGKLLERKGSSSGSGSGGSIINIGSVVSNYGNAGQVNYAASKGGVVGLTRSIAKEMALLSWKANSSRKIMGNYDKNDGALGRVAVSPTVRVNCIQPGMIVTLPTLQCLFIEPKSQSCMFAFFVLTLGFIATPMVQAVPERILSEVTNKIALKRLGHPEDVANLVLFLASGARSGYITGETFECSGMLRL
jgi:NAD(P)-dependent dehydrogenase (short-subunit alcohol dehydrogenase family)